MMLPRPMLFCLELTCLGLILSVMFMLAILMASGQGFIYLFCGNINDD